VNLRSAGQIDKQSLRLARPQGLYGFSTPQNLQIPQGVNFQAATLTHTIFHVKEALPWNRNVNLLYGIFLNFFAFENEIDDKSMFSRQFLDDPLLGFEYED
jgi:hypothetical protein